MDLLSTFFKHIHGIFITFFHFIFTTNILVFFTKLNVEFLATWKVLSKCCKCFIIKTAYFSFSFYIQFVDNFSKICDGFPLNRYIIVLIKLHIKWTIANLLKLINCFIKHPVNLWFIVLQFVLHMKKVCFKKCSL